MMPILNTQKGMRSSAIFVGVANPGLCRERFETVPYELCGDLVGIILPDHQL